MPRHTHKPGSKQQRKRVIPKVRRYRLPKVKKMSKDHEQSLLRQIMQ